MEVDKCPLEDDRFPLTIRGAFHFHVSSGEISQRDGQGSLP